MKSKATSLAEYLDTLADDRRELIQAIVDVIRANIDAPFTEGMQYGMPGWFLPHSVYPDGYHCDPKQPLPFASIASQKNSVSLYLFCIYTSPAEQERFVKEWKATGKRLDMGKSCVRIRKLDDVPLDVIAGAFRRIKAPDFVKSYEAARDAPRPRKPARKSAKKPAKKPAKKTPKK